MPPRLSPRRQFQILFGLCLGVLPAVVLGLTLIQNPPKAGTASADVATGLGALIIIGSLAAAALIVWARRAWLFARLAAVVAIAALLGAGALLTTILTGIGWRFAMLYLIVGLGFILTGLISTIVATNQR